MKLCKDGTVKHCYIHKLVANAFIENINNHPCINHIDRNRSNNCVENLEWCTYADNSIHTSNDTRDKKDKVHKLDKEKAREIKKLFGEVSVSNIAKKYGVDVTTIYAIKNNKIWKHVIL